VLRLTQSMRPPLYAANLAIKRSSIPSRTHLYSRTSKFSASLKKSLSGSCSGPIKPAPGFAAICCVDCVAAGNRHYQFCPNETPRRLWRGADSQLLLPRMKLYTGWSPNRVRKYQDKLDTHRTSRSRVPTPDWSIDLNCGVSGKGSFTRD
jgi:hypothetical protein